jgi:chloride channel 3/4/5
MAGDEERANEQSRLLPHNKRLGSISVRRGSDAGSIISSHLSKDELALGDTAVGERLAYNDYTTIDWLHDLVPSKPAQVVRWELLTHRPGQRLFSSSINP